MKIWRKYEEYLLKGEWHIHTKYSDGENSIFGYCEKANELKLSLIAFTEHVRKDLNYDFGKFLEDIERARKKFPELIILSGCEAKVLPDGELDIDEENLRKVDYPIFAFHSFPADLDLYVECIRKAIKNRFVNTWAHPGLFLKKNNLKINEKSLLDILKLLKRNDVLLEINRKYDLPPEDWNDPIKRLRINKINGNDIHSVSEIREHTHWVNKSRLPQAV